MLLVVPLNGVDLGCTSRCYCVLVFGDFSSNVTVSFSWACLIVGTDCHFPLLFRVQLNVGTNCHCPARQHALLLPPYVGPPISLRSTSGPPDPLSKTLPSRSWRCQPNAGVKALEVLRGCVVVHFKTSLCAHGAGSR